MKLPLSALDEYISVKVSVEKLAEKLLLSGTKVEEIKKIEGETVFELEITPNRADTLSFFGLAREISAISNLELNPIDTQLLIDLKKPSKKPQFKVSNKKLCPYYSIVTLSNINIKDSTGWIRETLKLSGIRPINNVIDITNLVMLETGQPMHAFDASKIEGVPTLRAAKKGEKVITLDGVEREVPEGSIVIEDEKNLIDLAGLMGGKSSEIDENTTKIVLLVPFYEPIAIRKASLYTGLRTEASNRFEKKLDPNMHPTALNRAIKLLVEEANATFETNISTIGYPVSEQSLSFDLSSIKQVLGIELDLSEVINLLSPLGFMVNSRPLEEGKVTITVPSHRPDVTIAEDILEEIGRIYGYNNIPKTLPQGEIPEQKELFETDKEKLFRDFLVSTGFSELTGYSLVSEADLKKVKLNQSKALKVLHPTSSDFVFLRPTLLINLLKAVATNNGRDNLAFFEIAKEFKTEIDQKLKLPKQEVALALISNSSFGKVKATLESLLTKFDISLTQKALTDSLFFSYGAEFQQESRIVAKIGLVEKNLVANFEVKSEVVFAWIDYEYLITKTIKNNYQPLPKFPKVVEDISFFITEKNLAGKIIDFVRKYDNLIKEVEAIDAFEKDNRTSLTLRLNFRSEKNTLTSGEVNKLRERLEKDLAKKFKVVLRKD